MMTRPAVVVLTTDCENNDDSGRGVQVLKNRSRTLEGTWTEQYDPTVFAMDGSVEYTFDGSNHYQMHVYDALSGESHDYSGTYAIDLINKGTITINPQMSDYSNVTYTLVKLTSKEMVWQKEGTTYSVGTWGSDYRHFVRVN